MTKIEGVLSFPLRRISDERGTVMHMLRCNDPHFERFGEIYFSSVNPGFIKAWHLHSRQTLNYAVVSGMAKVVLYDARENSKTHGIVEEIFIGEENYVLLRIPPGVYSGFAAAGSKPAIVANCTDIPHDPTEIQRLDPHSPVIPYDWKT